MFNVKKIQERSNSDISFFHEYHTHTDEYRAYFKEKYVKTKKWLGSNASISDDKLILTSITSWKSQDDFIDFVSDDYIIEHSISKNQKYDDDNQIISIYESEEL
jgi:hypothetical protein